jgi:hypothetical protein
MEGGTLYKCESKSLCMVTYSRAYTPILYEINPPVAYFGSKIAFSVDPKSTGALITGNDMAFIESKLD